MKPASSATTTTTTNTSTTTSTSTESDTKSFNLNEIAKSLADIKTTTKKPVSDEQETEPFPSNSSTFTSNYNSPALSSVPSSAFASALQSPYISPRATQPKSKPETRPVSPSSSHRTSDFFPSNSCTPPPERSDFSTTDQDERVLRALDQPRISFSFPAIPRVSFARGSSVSASSVNGGNTKLRSCDVFIGYHGQSSNRLARWLKSELEVQGIACFMADRSRYADSQSHEIADRVICSASYGIVMLSNWSLSNRFCVEEVNFFGRKKNLVPVLVDASINQITEHVKSVGEKEVRDAIDELERSHGVFNFEANGGEWRTCISRASSAMTSKLGRKSVADENHHNDLEYTSMEFPFPRNPNFVGREKEISEMELALFSNMDSDHLETQSMQPPEFKASTSGLSEGFADSETDRLSISRTGGGRRYISLEMARSSNSESWSVETGRTSMKRSKYKKSRSGKDKGGGGGGGLGCSMVSITGASGIGKTELALEFAYRYSQRYKMVFWVRGEARYMRQSILNLSLNLDLDLSADPDKERGRIRSFDEQEHDAFKRVKRELFKDVPYLIIIDNLEDESQWWEGKDLHDFIPRNTGGSHVIVTTRLSKVMNSDPALQLNPLPFSDAMALIRGRRCKDFTADELDFLKKFNDKLSGSTFGLWIVACLVSKLLISPIALYEAVDQLLLEDVACQSSFLVKLLGFCFDVLDKGSKRRNCLASKMLLVGLWFAPSPISANMLAAASKSLSWSSSSKRLSNWTQCLNQTVFCSSGCYLTNSGWKTEESSALMLVKLGLARKCTSQPGLWIQFHPLTTQVFKTKRDDRSAFAMAAALTIRKSSGNNPVVNSDHLWASVHLIFGSKSEPPSVQLKPPEMAVFIKKTALPLAIWTFTTFSRCNAALELLRACTSVLDEVEKSFVSRAQDRWHGSSSLCWRKQVAVGPGRRMDEYVWQEVTLLKATMMETRAKLMLRGGQFDGAEDLCRMCISIRTVMLGHSHAHTLAAQQTLAKLVRSRSKVV
ncbi:hypothetical protein V2J09_012660 [Rumex salicifolius]